MQLGELDARSKALEAQAFEVCNGCSSRSSRECATALLLQLEQKSANQRFLESSLKELRAAREADQLKVTTGRTKSHNRKVEVTSNSSFRLLASCSGHSNTPA
jgi:hypothetical protein